MYTVIMSEMVFEWDERKDRENRRKHGVSFDEVKTVFFDENAVEFYDDEHSQWENRFLMLGLSGKLRVLLVCDCLRESGTVIRIISARKATQKEREFYPRGAK
jgi:uncharacterized DUF497 family protein